MGKMLCKARGEDRVWGVGEHGCEVGPTQCRPQSASNPERKSHKDKLLTPEVQHKRPEKSIPCLGRDGWRQGGGNEREVGNMHARLLSIL